MRNVFMAAALCLLGLCGPAMADTRVSLRGLDFSDARDVVAAHDRVAAAAKSACDDSGSRGLAARVAERRCQIAFMEEAVAKINQPTMTAFYGALAGNVRLARFGDRAPQQALIALAQALPAANGAMRSAASE